MTPWALKRQLFVIFILLSIFVFFSALIYFLTDDAAPTCSDGIKNQSEIAIDCGDVCNNKCIFADSNVNVLFSRVFKESRSNVSALAMVRNSRTGFLVKDAYFEFTFFDKNGIVVNSYRNKIDILPNVDTPIFMTQRELSAEREITSVQFKFTRALEFVQSPRVYQFALDDQRIEDGAVFSKAYATITNDSQIEHRDVDVYALVYDKQDNVIAVSKTFVESIQAGKEQDLYFSWNHPFSRNVDQCKKPIELLVAIAQPIRGLVNRAAFFLSNLDKDDKATVLIPNPATMAALAGQIDNSGANISYKQVTKPALSLSTYKKILSEDVLYFLFSDDSIQSDDVEKIQNSFLKSSEGFFVIFLQERNDRRQRNVLNLWNPTYSTNQFDKNEAKILYSDLTSDLCIVEEERLHVIANTTVK